MPWSDGFRTGAPGKLVDTVEGARAYLPAPLPVGVALNHRLYNLVADARAELGSLSGIGTLSKNPALFVRSFQTREAAASSRIEGTKTTYEEALANQVSGIDAVADPDAKEVENYFRALQQGVDAIKHGRSINRGLLLELHRTVLEGVRGKDMHPGRFRETQNFVGKTAIREARFVPPPPLHVASCMDELLQYLETDSDDDPLVRLALVHYQFETIHPFEDGNGRIGRLLIALQTIEQGLQDVPLLYISPEIESRRDEYCDRLLAVSLTGDYLGWIEFFVRTMRESARQTADKIRMLVELIRSFQERLKDCETNGPVRLLRRLEEHPFLTVNAAATHLDVAFSTAKSAIDVLVSHGIVEESGAKLRGKGRPASLYWSPEIVRILG